MAGRVLRRIWPRLFEDRILGMAAEAGFWAIVSLPSLMLTLLGAIGYCRGVLGPANVKHIHDDVLRGARDLLTQGTVNSDVAPLLNQVLGRGHLAVISVGFVISLWSGSTAMSAYVNTITVAYDMRGVRGSVRSRLVATGLYLCFVAAGIALLPALALGARADRRPDPRTGQWHRDDTGADRVLACRGAAVCLADRRVVQGVRAGTGAMAALPPRFCRRDGPVAAR